MRCAARVSALAFGAVVALLGTPARGDDPLSLWEPSGRGPMVWVHLDVDHASLQSVGPDGVTPVCRAPCDEWVPRDGSYVLDGDRVPLAKFELDPDQGPAVAIKVKEKDDEGSVLGAVVLLA